MTFERGAEATLGAGGDGFTSSAVATLILTRHHLGPMLRTLDVKDKSYQQSPIGALVGRYLRSREWGDLKSNSLLSYETCLARFAREHDDYTGLDRFCQPDGPELIQDFLQRNWPAGASEATTRRQRLSAVKAFFQWALEADLIPWSPAARLKPPKGTSRERLPQQIGRLRQLIDGQDSLRDQACLMLLCQMGFRKNELRLVQVADIDFTSDEILVHGKGGKDVRLPIAFKRLRETLYLVTIGQGPDEYLLHPKSDTSRPMTAPSVHRWFKRCLDRAGLSQNIEMHALRHSAADAIWRATGNLILAQQLLRHESVATSQLYLHPNREDLIAGMRTVDAVWGEADG
jgi:site-specific recombinase XerC